MRKTFLALTLAILISINFSGLSVAQDNSRFIKPVARGSQSDESTYFIMTDRFENGSPSNDNAGISATKFVSGYSPSEIGWWHGGDFKGITKRLDYIKSMGFTSIWVTPPVVQKFIQGDSAAYHGYWGVDFTTVDPHLGTEADFIELVKEAHSRSIKVIVDVVTNHTADVISYKNGKPYIPANEAKIKNPSWLNDMKNYHNFGNNPVNESALLKGDFFGLDDLATEKADVVNGWIEVWTGWIDKFDIDGMRIDTFKHVDAEFWLKFIPKIKAAAAKAGKSDFPIFGEVADADAQSLASYVSGGQVPSVLDFAFQKTVTAYVQYGVSAQGLADLFNSDDLYTSATTSSYGLATFLGNHDMGRIGKFISSAVPSSDSRILIDRAKLANATLFLLRGGPVLYYGDEKGMTGAGGDKLARQDMFATQVINWQSELRIGSDPIGLKSSFEIENPLEVHISELQRIVAANPALRNGTQQTRYAKDGIFVVTRYAKGSEYIVAFNGTDKRGSSTFSVASKSDKWEVLSGDCEISNIKELTLTLPERSYCLAKAVTFEMAKADPQIKLPKVKRTVLPSGWREVSLKVNSDQYLEVTFNIREPGEKWRSIGTTDRKTFQTAKTNGGLYRTYLHSEDYKKGINLELIAAAIDGTGQITLSKVIKFKI